ncbi:MAG: hypothetical protein ACI8RD_010843, partial [Bacillariaceae sp.]
RHIKRSKMARHQASSVHTWIKVIVSVVNN